MLQKGDVKNIFSTTKCLSDEALMLYIQQKLNTENMRDIELHLADCEVCNDIVDGLRIAGDIQHFKSDIVEINQRLEKRINDSNIKIFKISLFYKYVIAASVFILIGIGFLFNYFANQTNQIEVASIDESAKQIAKIHTDTIENELPPIKQETIVQEKTLPKTLVKSQNIKENNADIAVKELRVDINSAVQTDSKKSIDANLSSGKAVFESADAALEEENDLAQILDKKTNSEEQNSQGDQANKEVVTFSGQSAPELSSQIETTGSSKRSTTQNKSTIEIKTESSSFDEAKKDFANGDYIAAKSKLEYLQNNDKKNEEVLFYLAKSERMLKEYSQSTKHFDKIIQNRKSIFYEESEWQKALNLIDSKKNTDAIILLKKISQGKGKYAYAAAEMMSELGE